jgi:hypothetical protein
MTRTCTVCVCTHNTRRANRHVHRWSRFRGRRPAGSSNQTPAATTRSGSPTDKLRRHHRSGCEQCELMSPERLAGRSASAMRCGLPALASCRTIASQGRSGVLALIGQEIRSVKDERPYMVGFDGTDNRMRSCRRSLAMRDLSATKRRRTDSCHPLWQELS